MMRLTYLTTHWTPEDAHAILSLLDELRDALWHVYGNEIIDYYQQHNAAKNSGDHLACNERQMELFNLEMDDTIPF